MMKDASHQASSGNHCQKTRELEHQLMGGNELFQQPRYKPHRFLSFCTTLTWLYKVQSPHTQANPQEECAYQD